jgi:MarR family transcriptional regulator, organic hydroperoxide resistance regulator
MIKILDVKPYKKSNTTEGSRSHDLLEQLQFLSQMSSTETAFFHQAAAAKNSLNITDSKTLSALMQEGPMTAGQLAQRLFLTTGAVTSIIDRLEKAGLAERASDRDDRRKVVVKVQTGKLKKIGNTYRSMGKAYNSLLANYTQEQLQFLVDYHKASIEMTKKEIEKLAK